VGEDFIDIMLMCDAGNVLVALTGDGYSDDVAECVGHSDIGLGQGSEDAPLEWNCGADVPACVLHKHGVQPAVVSSQGGKRKKVHGVKFADDDNNVNGGKKGAQRSADLMTLCHGFMGLEACVHKCKHMALEWNAQGRLQPSDFRVVVTDSVTGRSQELPRVDCSQAEKYLGPQYSITQEARHQVKLLKSKQVRTAGVLRRARTGVEGKAYVANAVNQSGAMYGLKHMAVEQKHAGGGGGQANASNAEASSSPA
jgi:hypothetical protein